MPEASQLDDETLRQAAGGGEAATYFTCSTCGSIVQETQGTVTESGNTYQAKYRCPSCKTYFFDRHTYSNIWYQTKSFNIYDRTYRSTSSLGTTNVGTF